MREQTSCTVQRISLGQCCAQNQHPLTMPFQNANRKRSPRLDRSFCLFELRPNQASVRNGRTGRRTGLGGNGSVGLARTLVTPCHDKKRNAWSHQPEYQVHFWVNAVCLCVQHYRVGVLVSNHRNHSGGRGHTSLLARQFASCGRLSVSNDKSPSKRKQYLAIGPDFVSVRHSPVQFRKKGMTLPVIVQC